MTMKLCLLVLILFYMIQIFHQPFYHDSGTFASSFWQTICFTDWLQLNSNISVFPGQPLISLVFLNIFYFFHFSNDLWVNNNLNAWLISSPACYWFDFNKTLRFTAGVTSEKLQSRPIMTKFDPTQPSHMHSAIKYEKKKNKRKKMKKSPEIYSVRRKTEKT